MVRIEGLAKSLLMHSRASTPTSFFGQQKTFPFTPSGGGLPLYRTTRTTVFQSAVKQLKKKSGTVEDARTARQREKDRLARLRVTTTGYDPKTLLRDCLMAQNQSVSTLNDLNG